MDDVKDKLKGLMNKVNGPFSSSSAKFKGQGRVLGSSPTPSSSRPSTNPPRSHVHPQRSDISANGFDQFAPVLPSGTKGVDLGKSGPFECPVCEKGFPSEEEVAGHVELCLEGNKGGEGDAVSEAVFLYLSSEPPQGSVEVLARLLGNVGREPENAKFRRVRMGNPKIKEAVGDVKGAVGVLECVGFSIGEEEGEVWASMDTPSSEQLVRIKEVVALLEKKKDGSQKIEAAPTIVVKREPGKMPEEVKEIDRKVRVFFPVPGRVAEQINLPDSFYKLSAQELKREVEQTRNKIADSQLLIPRSYKEKQMQAVRKKHSFTVIRIQFPDGVIVQAVFRPWEFTGSLYEFVSSTLKEPALEFDLLLPAMHKPRVIPHSSKPGCKAPTLEEEQLVPSVLLKFRPKETDLVPFTGLRSELLEASEPLSAAASISNNGRLS